MYGIDIVSVCNLMEKLYQVHDKLRISDIIRKIGNDSYNAQQYAYALEKYTKVCPQRFFH